MTAAELVAQLHATTAADAREHMLEQLRREERW